MADMHKVGAKNKQSGNALENQTAKDFSAWYKKEFHRAPGSGSLHWHSVNVTADVLPPNDIDFPFIIECKSDKSSNWNIESFMNSIKRFPVWTAQANREASSPDSMKTPLLVFKRNRVKSYVSFPFTDKVVAKLLEKNISFAVSFIEYTSETKNQKYKYRCIALPLWQIMEFFTPEEFENCFTETSLKDSLIPLGEIKPTKKTVNVENINL